MRNNNKNSLLSLSSLLILSCFFFTIADAWPEAAISLLRHVNNRLLGCKQPIHSDIRNDEEDTPDPNDGAFELRLLNITYFATMVRYKDAWAVLGDVVPDPCGIDRLAISAYEVIQINEANLGWTAAISDSMRGKTDADFGFPPNPPPPSKKKPLKKRRDGFFSVFPEAYDARDLYPGEFQCKAFTPRAQGGCGSCTHFAASSVLAARLCLQNGRSAESNVVFSPQQLMACTGGCSGGQSSANLGWYVTNSGKIKEEWCKPYIGTDSSTPCNTTCDNANARSFNAASFNTVFGESAMQLELLLNGPGAIAISVYRDFLGYSSGVYSRYPNTTINEYVGGHAMMLVGWGVTSGTPYWIVQNSWSEWGEKGFMRLKRGTDECGIESSGMDVAIPKMSTLPCPTPCGNGSTALTDCSCRCDNPFMGGEKCDQIVLKCQHGGVLNREQNACICPLNFIGRECQNGIILSHYAATYDNMNNIVLTYVNALVTNDHWLYPKLYDDSIKSSSEEDVVLSGALKCFATLTPVRSPSPCPIDGNVSIKLQRPTAPGRYRVEITINTPGIYIVNKKIMAYFTVLPSYASSTLELDAAIAANRPTNIVDAQIAANNLAYMQTTSQMVARLDIAMPIKQILIEQTRIRIAKVQFGKPGDVFWSQAPPTTVCYELSSYLNENPKQLQFFSPSSGKIWYTVTNPLLPEAPKGCVNISVPTIANIPNVVTLNVIDANTGNVLATTNPTFFVSNVATIAFSTTTSNATTVSMKVMAVLVRAVGVVRTTDTIRLFDKNNVLAGTCPCFPTGVLPTPVSINIYCMFKLPKKAATAPTRAPFKVQYFGNDNTLIPVSKTFAQLTVQANAVSKLGI